MLERVGIEESGRLEEAVLDAGRARALVDVASAVLSTLEVGEVVTRVAWGARTLLRSRRAAILAYDPGTATLSGVTGLGIRPDHVRGLRLRLAESATVELAVLDGRARHSEQAYGEPTIKLALGLDSFVCIPLKTNDELRGVVLVDVAADAFGPDERRLADEFGHLASIGLENARKHRRARLPTALAGASRASQELHDTVLQALFAIGVEADGLVTHSPEDEKSLRAIGDLASAAARDLRAAIQVLCGGKHLLLGLAPALDELAQASARRTGLEIDVAVAPYLREANDGLADVLYRVCREGLANVERHAHASGCRIRCDLGERWVTAVVEDDGVGIRAASDDAHFGLAFAREAVEALGGTLRLEPGAERGAVLTARLPLEAE